jgi:predicted Zn-dependent peptidase
LKHSVKEVILNNGAKGLLINVPGATVMDYEINFRAGEYLVPREKWEVPHLMEHVVLGANEKYKKARLFQAEFEKNGAYTNAHTSVVSVGYEAECADFEWDRILDMLLLSISKPLFLREEVSAETGNIKDELVARSNNHFRTLALSMNEAQGLLAMTDRERLKQMKNVRRKDLIEHYSRTHTTKNMRFIIAGELKGREAKIKKALESVPLPQGAERFSLPNELPLHLKKPVFVTRASVKNVYFGINAFALKRFSNPDMDALEMVNTMLTATLHSRILGEARERGLVYSMDSGVDVARSHTGWWFGAQVMVKNAPALFEIIVRELKKVQAGDITAKDLDAAKQYLLGRHQRSGQTVGGTMAGYSGRYFFDEVINNYHAIPERIRAVSRDRITKVTRRMFSDKIGGLGVLTTSPSRRELADELNHQLQPLWPSK